MAFLAIQDGKEWIYEFDKDRTDTCKYNFIELPTGTILKLLGRNLRPDEMPVQLKLTENGRF